MYYNIFLFASICDKLIEIGEFDKYCYIDRRWTKWVARPAPAGGTGRRNGHGDAYCPRADANGTKRTEFLSEMGRPAGDALTRVVRAFVKAHF